MRSRLLHRCGRAVPVLLAVTGLTVAGLTAPGQAAPPAKPGKVTALAVGTVAKPSAAYLVPTTWRAAARATTYRVALVNAAGATLDTDTVTDTAWTARTTAVAGTSVRVRVTPYAGTRKGKPAHSSFRVLPDLTAPQGTFEVVVAPDGRTATVNQVSLSDDLTAPDAVSRSVDWGESPEPTWQAWTTGSSVDHAYPAVEGRHVPRVRLVDTAGNASTLTLHAVVVNDHVAPTGSYASSTAKAWARLTTVRLTQSGLADNWTPADLVQRQVDWGDGSPLQTWAHGSTPGHVYRVGGSFTPRVTVTDEAGNTAVLDAAGVTVRVDSARPVLRVKVPRTGRTTVRKWTTLRGTARDTGTGVRVVRVKAVEKRGTRWYAFKPGTRTWVKAGTTRAGALRRAGVRIVVPTRTGTWSARLPRLAKGTLHYRVVARDRVGNVSKVAIRTQRLTRR